MRKNNNNIIRGIVLLCSLLILSSCGKNYPITVYDTDLDNRSREFIIKTFDESIGATHKNETTIDIEEEQSDNRIIVSDDYIDEEYLKYEVDLWKNIKVATESTIAEVIFRNLPDFDLKEYDISKSFSKFSDLDSLGRVSEAFALLGKETLPNVEVASNSIIKPSGWKNIKYDNIEGGYLYNRCLLIGRELLNEVNNEKNIFTGTSFFNANGLLPYEKKIAEYIKRTGNHVLYRVKPFFIGSNLIASHIQLEALSVEDNGRGISYNVKINNVQPGIHINYSTGESFEEIIVASGSETND